MATTHHQTRQKITSPWLIMVCAIFILKLGLYTFDHLPMFFLHDSIVYLDTAIRGYIPVERSFVYGFLVRAVAGYGQSLDYLILAQIVASALSVLILIHSLQVFFVVSLRIAFLAGVLCALEPLQLIYERYVLTETFSLVAFSAFTMFSLYYLKSKKWQYLVAIQILGVFVISLRMSFLPIIYFSSIALPLLAFIETRNVWRTSTTGQGGMLSGWRVMPGGKELYLSVLMHLLISLGAMTTTHFLYRQVNGYLTANQPGYHYNSGFWLMGFFAPILQPSDFPRESLATEVFAVQLALTDRVARDAQINWPGGIVANLRAQVPNLAEAEQLARQTVIHALFRDPLATLRFVVADFLEFWNIPWLRLLLDIAKGNRELPLSFQIDLQHYFHLDAKQHPFLITLSNRYFFRAWPWYLFLLCSPLLALGLFLGRGQLRKANFIICAYLAITVPIAVILSTYPNVRYLHAVGWMVFFPLGQLLDLVLGEKRSSLESGEVL